MKRPTVYQIVHNKTSYPDHMQVLEARSRHVLARLRSRFELDYGFGTYLKLSELCGRAVAGYLRDPRFRFVPSPDHGLGSLSNPKYRVILVIGGKKMLAVYDAFDMMLLTVVPYTGYRLHGKIEKLETCVFMADDGNHRILEDVR